jgi:hypothetical protein
MMTTTQTQTQTAPKTMIAKYSGRCACGCGGSITAGQTAITWSRETGARLVHGATAQARPSSPVRSTHRARPGKWTGCSCGSRVDGAGDLIYSSRNCASCEHDA